VGTAEEATADTAGHTMERNNPLETIVTVRPNSASSDCTQRCGVYGSDCSATDYTELQVRGRRQEAAGNIRRSTRCHDLRSTMEPDTRERMYRDVQSTYNDTMYSSPDQFDRNNNMFLAARDAYELLDAQGNLALEMDGNLGMYQNSG
jgi:hypothetical protein